MNGSFQQNLDIAMYAVPLVLLAFALHEMAHAYVATWFGDPTPAQHGRKTLNPIRHLDPVGTALIVISMLVFGFPFGFAVTPVNDSKMRKPRLHGALTAFAGPAVNIIICIISTLVVVSMAKGLAPDDSVPVVYKAAYYAMLFNAFLAVFNLLPIPPLDGGRIVGSILKPDLAREWNKIGEYGMFIIIGLVLLGGSAFTQLLRELQRLLLNLVGYLTGNPGLGTLV